MAAFIIYIIRWALCLTLLYSLFGLCMKRETLHSVNRVILLAVMAGSMVLPLVQVSTPESNIVTQGREMMEYQIAHAQTALGEDAERVWGESDGHGAPHEALPTRDDVSACILVCVAVYLAGLAISWLRYVWQMSALVLTIRRSNRIEVGGVPGHVRVLVHPDVKSPCSWMKYILLNPSDAKLVLPRPGGRRAGGEALLRHELEHIRLGHSWDMLLCEVTCRMLWFLPFAWMLRQDLRDVHEYQADRRVLQSGIRDEEYQLLLIKKATSTGLQPVVNAFNQSPIKRRFKMMYQKPSRRWVALKAAYLLPLSALAVVAFARPQALSEIEEKVETEVTKAVATVVQNNDLPAPAEQEEPTVQPIVVELKDTVQTLPDANLVKADLAESGGSVLGGFPTKSATELLDSTMQAVGARKIADGTYIGHFQPNLNSDTVRIAHATILDRQSQQTDEHLFAQNVDDPYAYNVTLNAETRKDRKGYYIRYLQPVNSAVRNYDKKEIDPMMLSTDSVLTGRSDKRLVNYYLRPIAIERNKKETRIFMYLPLRGGSDVVDNLLKQKINLFKDLALVDEYTGDKYVCRAMDYDYFKYVKYETLDDDTVQICQMCLVFPPISKRVEEAHFGRLDSEERMHFSFDLYDIPRKGRVITK